MKQNWIYLKMEFEKLKDGIGNIGKFNWKYWKKELETLENGIWGHWKMGLKILENGIGNIGKLNLETYSICDRAALLSYWLIVCGYEMPANRRAQESRFGLAMHKKLYYCQASVLETLQQYQNHCIANIGKYQKLALETDTCNIEDWHWHQKDWKKHQALVARSKHLIFSQLKSDPSFSL